MDKVTAIQDFKFDSLHKYMRPLYAELNFNCYEDEEKKQKLVKKIVPQFFVRLRKFRGWSAEQVTKRLNVETREIELFESGNAGTLTKSLEESYVLLLGGARELAASLIKTCDSIMAVLHWDWLIRFKKSCYR